VARTKARAARRKDLLATYTAKRRFDETPEPRGRVSRRQGNLYTIQKHAARRLHYDLRLELDGVLKSWAITKGPSLDPSQKRLAVRTEDHPIDYAKFEGRIPEGNYGAGSVLLWDEGSWEPIEEPHRALEKGKLAFRLSGKRLNGRWALVRFKGAERSKRENWLLIKELDEFVDRDAEVTADNTASVASGREMPEIADDPEAVWKDTGEEKLKPKRRTRRKTSPLPAFREMQLATLVDDVPKGRDWVFEMKFDGYRALAAVSGDAVRIHTRGGLDWTGRYPRVARALARLGLDGALLDGEIVAIDDKGRSDFSLLQESLKSGDGPLSYFVFDLLAERGKSLAPQPLAKRKARLKTLLADAPRDGPIFYVDHVSDGQAMLETLCKNGWEGVIAKRSAAPYRSGRGKSWLKVKCGHEQEFVIVGWSPSDKRRPFSSILLGLKKNGRLTYAGRAGSGFGQRDLAALSKRFAALARKTPPLDHPVPRAIARDARWIAPKLVAEIAFAEFTRDGIVRHGRFLGLREDKAADEVTEERPEEVETVTEAKTNAATAAVAGIRLTHPDKVLFPQQGITKRHLAEYLDLVSDRMLPYCAGRLISLVRCPEGRSKKCFFQRHVGSGLPEALESMEVQSKDGSSEQYLYLTGRPGLVATAQMGVLELHIWGSRIDDIERPDRIVFDLDPDPSVDFATVKASAMGVRDALDALGLRSFPLLTGGKGIHVVAPLMRRHEWPTVKSFTKALAERFAENEPDRYIATMSKAKRKGRIFIDYLRNERSATAISPYSARARDGAPVAWPVTWKELDGVDAANIVTVESAYERLRTPDPWKDYADVKQSLTAAALRALGV
jgi:bifunctional non-homologous end joining protein LigD